jgi:glycosyl transferase, family 25
MKVFLINLDRSPDRLAFMQEQARTVGLELDRISAVDGRTMALPFLGNTFADYLSPGERGCYASHLLFCKKIIDLNLTHAMVIEDDAVLGPHSMPMAERAVAAAPADWDFIHLSGLTRHATSIIAQLDGTHKLVWYSRRPPFNSAGYLMSAAGAAKFLAPRHRILPNDADVRRQGVFQFNVYGVEPRIIGQTWAFKSVADHDNTVSRRYRRIERSGRLRDWAWRARQVGPSAVVQCAFENTFLRFTDPTEWRRRRERTDGPPATTATKKTV